jgi:exonuclease III
MNILQWKVRGLSSPKMPEIKKTINEENIDVLIMNEANITKKVYNMNGYTIYALHKSRQIASGILAAVKTTLTSEFHITKALNEADTSEISHSLGGENPIQNIWCIQPSQQQEFET